MGMSPKQALVSPDTPHVIASICQTGALTGRAGCTAVTGRIGLKRAGDWRVQGVQQSRGTEPVSLVHRLAGAAKAGGEPEDAQLMPCKTKSH